MRTDDRFRRAFVAWRGRAPSAARRLPAPGAHARCGPLLASPLFSWPGKLRMALDLVLPRGGDGRREPRRLRAPPPGPRGARAGGPAAGRRASTPPTRRSVARRHHAALHGARAARAERHPGPVARRTPGAGRGARARAAPAGRSSSRSPRAWKSWCARWRARLPPGSVRAQGARDRRGARGRRLARDDAGRRRPRRRRRDPHARGASDRAPAPLPRSLARALARGDPVRVLGDGDARLSPRGHPPSPRRLRLRGAARRGAAHHRGHLLEREVSRPRPRGPRACSASFWAARSARRSWSRTTGALAEIACAAAPRPARRRRGAALDPRRARTGRPCPSTTSATWRASRRSSWRWPASRPRASPAEPIAASGIADCVRSGEDAASRMLAA